MQVPIQDNEAETTQVAGHAPEAETTHNHEGHNHAIQVAVPAKSRLKKIGVLLGLIVLVSVTTWALTYGIVHEGNNKVSHYAGQAAVNTKAYQALFLTNGQVYFGKLSNVDKNYVTLTNIFYLQVQQSTDTNVQPAGNSTAQTGNSQVSLAKLGDELHGPQDKMEVSSQQVLFWENLKSDSKVVQAITNYQNK